MDTDLVDQFSGSGQHGDSDHVVPIAGVQAAVSRLQDGELIVTFG